MSFIALFPIDIEQSSATKQNQFNFIEACMYLFLKFRLQWVFRKSRQHFKIWQL